MYSYEKKNERICQSFVYISSKQIISSIIRDFTSNSIFLKTLIENFHILKYGLQMKKSNHEEEKEDKINNLSH